MFMRLATPFFNSLGLNTTLTKNSKIAIWYLLIFFPGVFLLVANLAKTVYTVFNPAEDYFDDDYPEDN